MNFWCHVEFKRKRIDHRNDQENEEFRKFGFQNLFEAKKKHEDAVLKSE